MTAEEFYNNNYTPVDFDMPQQDLHSPEFVAEFAEDFAEQGEAEL